MEQAGTIRKRTKRPIIKGGGSAYHMGHSAEDKLYQGHSATNSVVVATDETRIHIPSWLITTNQPTAQVNWRETVVSTETYTELRNRQTSFLVSNSTHLRLRIILWISTFTLILPWR